MLARNFIHVGGGVRVKLILQQSICTTSHFFSHKNKDDSKDPVISPENSKLLRVAIIGLPNAGKSTIINRLLNFDVCPVSKKAHTTRESQRAVFLEDNTQIVFVDTPGVVNIKEKKQFSLPDEFVKAPEASMRDVDLVAVMHDVTNNVLRHKLDPRIIATLQRFPTKPAILILNKIDVMKLKRKLLDAIFYLSQGVINGEPIPFEKTKRFEPKLKPDRLFEKTRAVLLDKKQKEADRMSESSSSEEENQKTHITPEYCEDMYDRLDPNGHIVRGWPNFRDVFLISALEGDGVDLVMNYFKNNAKPSEWAYNEDVLTDCPPASLCLRILKSKMLEYLPNQVPYIIAPTIEYWDKDPTGALRIAIGLDSPKDRISRVIVGYKGNVINVLKAETQRTLSNLLQVQVDLTLNVKVVPKKKPNSSSNR